VTLELGYRAGLRGQAERESSAANQVGAIQGAVLGMLGLLLGFSFASAGGRFLERQDLIVQEANAIGTAWLRADLLPEPHRSNLRDALKGYTQHRINLSHRLRDGISAADATEVDRRLAEIWRAARNGVEARPAVMLGVLPPVNDVIDYHSTRVAAGKKHLPLLVVSLLIACSALAMGVIGFGNGLGGRRRLPLSLPLAVLVGTSLWITIDLDHPREGLLRLSDEPLMALKFPED
jgi:hypothetical protein